MALNLGQLLGGAGVVATRMRQAEEAERVARQNQLNIEEQNRQALDQMRRAQEQDPRFAPIPSGMPQYQPIQFQQMPQRQMPVPAAPLGYQGPTAEQLAFEEANITPGPVGRGEVPPPPGPTPVATATRSLRELEDQKVQLMRQLSTAPGGGRGRYAIQQQIDALNRQIAATRSQVTQAQRIADITGPAVPQPVAPQPPVVSRDVSPAPVPTAPETVVAPAVQAQRDQEAARIRAQELGTVERADAELRSIEAELKRTKEATSKQILQQQRDMVKAARDVLAVAPAAAPAAVAAPTPAPAVVAPQATLAPVAQNIANEVLNATPRLLQVDPARLSQAMQETQESLRQQREIMVQQRNGLARMAQLGMQSGTAAGQRQAQEQLALVSQADLALRQFDLQTRQAMIYMQGMEGLQIFAQTNNPAALAGVWSYFSKVPIGVQPRSDGQFDLFVDGQLSEEGLSKAQIQERAQLGMFQSARDAVAKSAELRNTLALKRQFSDAQINAMKDIWVALINGQTKLAEKQADAMQGKLTVDTNAGGAYFQTPQGLVFLSPGGIVPVPGGGQQRIMNVTPVVIPGR